MSTMLACEAAATVCRSVHIAARFAGIDGWLHPAQGFALHELARIGSGEGQIVEIGSFMGLSACWLAAGLQERGGDVVYCVDTFKGHIPHAIAGQPGQEYGDTYPIFSANLKKNGLGSLIHAIVSDSLSAARGWDYGPIRLLFIDAGHEYHEVKADFEAWSPHLEPGASVAIHDVGDFPGVTKFYEEVLVAGWTEILAVGSLRVIRRTA